METPKRVLVVEEAEAYRQIMAELLRKAGYVVVEEAGAAAAHRRLDTEPPFDLLLLDLQMHGAEANGLYAYLKARPAEGRPPILALTTAAQTHRVLERLRGLQVVGIQDKRLVWDQLVYRVGGLLYPKRADQRAVLRAPAGVPVNVRTGERHFQAVVANVSATGMFLASPERLEAEERLSLQFILPGLPNLFEVTGRVVWRREETEHTEGGVGVQFEDLAEEDAAKIGAYVRAELFRLGPTARVES
ncbi:MAG: PilZ domain-containing protein [candidate division NC10 bacterium]|nr:PilZ domain-containing protein [candidate division NC10 bacterium]